MTRHRSGRNLAILVGAALLTTIMWWGASAADPSPFPEESPTIIGAPELITGATVGEAVAAVNQAVVGQGLALDRLAVTDVMAWLEQAKDFDLIKAEREAAWPLVAAGAMPRGWGFDVQNVVGPEIMVYPFALPIMNAAGFIPYFSYYQGLLGPNLDLATEPYAGPPPSLTASPTLSPSVQVRVTPIDVQGTSLSTPTERSALDVEIRLSPDTLDAAADYFSLGFGRDPIRERLAGLLGAAPERWVDLKQILPDWVGERANTFPSGNDTEVCYGAAREFFYPQQDPRHNRSTEASNLLLHDHYCLLGDDVSPTFGDYLSVPNQHAGRYILKDPTSGRDIGFSVQSGGNAPYRFYWVDEDFSATPFGHTPDAQVFRTRVDVWRRCK